MTLEVKTKARERAISYCSFTANLHILRYNYYLSITMLLVEDARVVSPPLAIQ